LSATRYVVFLHRLFHDQGDNRRRGEFSCSSHRNSFPPLSHYFIRLSFIHPLEHPVL
jgi:hypothetical protein